MMKMERVSTRCWATPPRLGPSHTFLPGKSLPSLLLSPPPFPVEPGAHACQVSAVPPQHLQPSHLLPLLSLQGPFCWTNLWNGIKTNRCPRTVCIAARESLLPRLRHPLAINCCLYRSACCFSCTVSLLQGCLVFAIEWASLLAVQHCSLGGCSAVHFTLQIGESANVLTVIMCTFAVSILYMCIK